MDAIQRLRQKAQANNKLASTKEQKVTVQQVNNKQVIAIEPTDPNTVYVPYYDPGVVYGSWSYPEYPPYYFPTPSYIGAGMIATGITFGAGYALGRWASGGNYWGGNVNWNNNNINIDRPINGAGGANWRPSVDHRQNAGNRGGRQQGLDFRGSGGQQVINPGNKGAKVGDHGGNRAGSGERGKGSHAATRPSGDGKRHHAAAKPSGGDKRHHAAAKPSGGGKRHHAADRQHASTANRARTGAGAGNRGGGARAHVSHHAGAGATHRAGGGGMHRGGGGGRGGGGRRSDIRLKHDIVLVGRLPNGLGVYRFSYNGSNKAYVGVIAQEVKNVIPQAVERGSDGFLRVHYRQLGVKFETYDQWLQERARIH
jgi:hypothetical protein